MKDLVLDLINSYEHRVVAVESLVLSAYETTGDSGDGLSQAYKTEQKLKADLRETLARNSSLRRTDFDSLTSKIFGDIEAKRAEIEEERRLIRERLKAYLGRQKELITSLKGQLTKANPEDSSQDNLEQILTEIKITQQDEGEQTFAQLQDFRFRLKTYCQELDELNNKLQRTLERGELLKLEDLRHLQASWADERRKTERKLRKEDVQRLLAHFNRERQAGIH
jgi:regulator of replication initiation timing